MIRYIARRVALAGVVVIGVFVVTFIISHLVPSDPARLYAGGQRATPADVNAARVELGLDKPVPVQFVIYVSNAVEGNFGMSFVTRRSVKVT